MADFLENRSHDPTDHIYWRDEILQVMFWHRGEGFGEWLGTSDLQRFLLIPSRELALHLRQMVDAGYLSGAFREQEPKYRLTLMGEPEARRRFMEEFEELRKPGHYECNNPDCDCHDPSFVGVCKNLQG